MPTVDHRIDLTDRKVKALKPAKKGERYQVMDAQVPGFGVRVTDKGARTFILRTRFPGGTSASRREIGKCDVVSLADAREKARQWTLLVKQGKDPAQLERQSRAQDAQKLANSFAAVAEDWFTDKLATERKGAEVERDVRKEFMPKLGKIPVAEITEGHILTVINAKKRSAPAQARNLLGHAKRFFQWTIDQRTYGLTASPCEHLKPTKIIGRKKSRRRILSNDELFALWRVTGRLPYPHGPVYRLLILNALRLNEVADARKQEFDWRQQLWTIPPERMKGENEEARAHVVPITAASSAVFESLPKFKKGTYLFSTTFGTSPAWMSDKVKKRIDRRMLLTLRALARHRGDDPAAVTLPHWINHDIRRTVRSHLSRLKVTEEAREAVLAHARPGIKGTYDLHDYLDEKREALELWAARLRSIVEPQSDNVIKFHAMA